MKKPLVTKKDYIPQWDTEQGRLKKGLPLAEVRNHAPQAHTHDAGDITDMINVESLVLTDTGLVVTNDDGRIVTRG